MTTARSEHQSRLLNGVPELVVLELLSRRPMYGYELVQAIKSKAAARSHSAKAASIRCCTSSKPAAILSSRRIEVGGRSRVVYRVTPKGSKQRAASLAQWSEVVAAVSRILQGGKHEHQHVRTA